MMPDPSKGELAYEFPCFLPDARTLCFSVIYEDGSSNLMVQNGKTRYTLLPGRLDGRLSRLSHSSPGHMMYQRMHEGSPDIWAIPFDLNRLTVTGEPFLVAKRAGIPSVSSDGILMYRSFVFRKQPVVWLDRAGVILDTLARPEIDGIVPPLSPDDRLVALSGELIPGDPSDIWVFDRERGTRDRVTRHPAMDREPS